MDVALCRGGKSQVTSKREPEEKTEKRNNATAAPVKFSSAFSQAHGAHQELSETLGDREADLALDQDPTLTISAKGSEAPATVKTFDNSQLKAKFFL